jgi:hypothetical protein
MPSFGRLRPRGLWLLRWLTPQPLPKPNSDIAPRWTSSPWLRNLNQTASGKPGALHTDDLVGFVEGQTSFGTQRRPPIPLGRDHEGSDTALLQLSDDLENNYWRTGNRDGDARIN